MSTFKQRAEAYLAEHPDVSEADVGVAVGHLSIMKEILRGLVPDKKFRPILNLIFDGNVEVRAGIARAAGKEPEAPKAAAPRKPAQAEKSRDEGPPIDGAWEAANRSAMTLGCSDMLRRQLETGKHWLKTPGAIQEARASVDLPPLPQSEVDRLRAMQERIAAR